jgi:protein O-mannosyl-transferase
LAPKTQKRKAKERREKAAVRDASERRADLLATAIPLAVTALVYLRCLPNGFVYDDNEMIRINRFIGDWSFLWKAFTNDLWWFRDPYRLPQSSYYRPLQDVWLALNYHLFGLHPAGWHVTSIALQLVAVYLVFRITHELTRDRIAAAFAAALYGLMPIHAQAVVWASAIPLSLSGAFALGSILCFIRSDRERSNRMLVLALGLFAAALLSHESPVVLPVIIAAYVYLLEPIGDEAAEPAARARLWRAARESAPFFAVDAAYLALRLRVLGFIARINATNDMTRAERLFSMPGAVANYVALLLIPWRAGPAHQLVIAGGWTAPAFYLPLAGLAATALALWLVFATHPHRRLYLFCAVWAVAAIAPVINLGSLSPVEMIQDRYLYLASAAWCIFLGDVAVELTAAGGALVPIGAGAVVLFTIVSGAWLWHIEPDWHDNITYFSKCIEMFPGSWLCHGRLGLELEAAGDLRGAERELEDSSTLRPADGAALYNLGTLHAQLGDFKRAEDELGRSLKLLQHPPQVAYLELAEIADRAGDEQESQRLLERSAAMAEGPVPVAIARAKIELLHGRYADAEAALKRLLPKYENVADIWAILGATAVRQGHLDEALYDYRTALKLAPTATALHIATAMTLARMGRRDDALAECQRALAMDPTNAQAHQLMQRLGQASAAQ